LQLVLKLQTRLRSAAASPQQHSTAVAAQDRGFELRPPSHGSSTKPGTIDRHNGSARRLLYSAFRVWSTSGRRPSIPPNPQLGKYEMATSAKLSGPEVLWKVRFSARTSAGVPKSSVRRLERSKYGFDSASRRPAWRKNGPHALEGSFPIGPKLLCRGSGGTVDRLNVRTSRIPIRVAFVPNRRKNPGLGHMHGLSPDGMDGLVMGWMARCI